MSKISHRGFQLVILFGLSLLLLFGQGLLVVRNQKNLVDGNLAVWRNQLAIAISENDRQFIERFTQSFFNILSYVQVSSNLGPLYSVPNEQGPVNCVFPLAKPIDRYGQTVGVLSGCLNNFEIVRQALTSPVLGLMIILLFVMLYIITVFPLRRYKQEVEDVMSILERDGTEAVLPSESLFWGDVVGQKLWRLIQEGIASKALSEKLILEAKAQESIHKLASQVSHDIRSPLSALNMVVASIAELPEDKRVLMRSSVNRINDIANELLKKGRRSISSAILAKNDDTRRRPELFSALVEQLISEKRMQSRNKYGLSISLNFRDAYGLFIDCEAQAIKRVLSNLINNSIEAIKSSEGLILVTVEGGSDNVRLLIEDNGCGIPAHVLSRLGKENITYGKLTGEGGNGIGFLSSKEAIERFGGQISVDSTVGVGTKIEIALPRVCPPAWFAPFVSLAVYKTIVVCDDDQSIHDLWKQRFHEFGDSYFPLQIFHFTNPEEFKSWFKSQKDQNQLLVFMDFEFIGTRQNGLDLIEELSLSQKAFLVTSRYEEQEIQKRCLVSDVKLIPKGLAPFIPIETDVSTPTDISVGARLSPFPNSDQSNLFATAMSTRYDLCLIDDDIQLIHPVWHAGAKSRNLNVQLFSTPQDFLSMANRIDRNTPIYVDVSLGNGVSGVDFAEEIHRLGFTEIILTTGYSSDAFVSPPFVREIIGKDFPI